jgi:hypothetical protein
MRLAVILMSTAALALAACSSEDGGGSDSGTDADTDIDADTDTDTDADADTDTGTDADADSDTDTDADTDTDTDTDTELSCGEDTACGEGCVDCTSSEEICNEGWGICVVPDCAGEGDFTPCEIATSPDRSYDICIAGACQSPGCGTLDCNPPGPSFPLPDTGQRFCFGNDTDALSSCPTSDTDAFYGQDAQYGWDIAHDADERFTRDTSTPGEPVALDTVTGLMWQGCPLGMTGDECEGGSATSATWSEQLVNCDGLDWGGRTDWRLPDRYELWSIVDYGVSGPYVDATAFPETPNHSFWSSSGYDTSRAWNVDFLFGRVGAGGKTLGCDCRCVRSGPVPHATRFARDTSISDAPVVADDVTGLEWQGCAAGLSGDACETGTAETTTWQAALAYCAALSWGGRADWRLPSVGELSSLVVDHVDGEYIDTTAFLATPSAFFWSSTSDKVSPDDAWLVSFGFGSTGTWGKTYDIEYVRCVR